MTEDKERKLPEGAGADVMSEAEIDRNLAESFPASDPPSWTLGTDHDTQSRDPSADQSDQDKGS